MAICAYMCSFYLYTVIHERTFALYGRPMRRVDCFDAESPGFQYGWKHEHKYHCTAIVFVAVYSRYSMLLQGLKITIETPSHTSNGRRKRWLWLVVHCRCNIKLFAHCICGNGDPTIKLWTNVELGQLGYRWKDNVLFCLFALFATKNPRRVAQAIRMKKCEWCPNRNPDFQIMTSTWMSCHLPRAGRFNSVSLVWW
jgi:hypothetical protein